MLITAALSGIEAAELTNLISHPLSYIRLLGFGLASVVIASIIDKIFTPKSSSWNTAFYTLSYNIHRPYHEHAAEDL